MSDAAAKKAQGGTEAGKRRPARVAWAERPIEQRKGIAAGARRFTPYLGVDTEHGTFVVNTTDEGVGLSMYVKRTRPEFAVLQRVVSALHVLLGDDATAGRQFVDVGANIGTETVPALIRHGFGRAVCCEPGLANYRLLRANLGLNGIEEDRVRTLNAAISDHPGRSAFVEVRESGGNNWLLTAPEVLEADRAARLERDPEGPVREEVVTEVDVTTIDTLAAEGVVAPAEVGLLWIDVEGHEAHVLRGATSLTELGVPTVLEFEPDGLARRGDFDALLEIAERSFTDVLDVRRVERREGRRHLELRRVGDLAAIADWLLDDESPSSFTDLLFLRLDDEQRARGAELSELVVQKARPRSQPQPDASSQPAPGDGRVESASNMRSGTRRP